MTQCLWNYLDGIQAMLIKGECFCIILKISGMFVAQSPILEIPIRDDIIIINSFFFFF